MPTPFQRCLGRTIAYILLLSLLLLFMPAVGQAQFSYTTNNGAITITVYDCSGSAANIPGTINGWPVTRIGPQAFIGCTTLTNVTIPEGVTDIEDGAFNFCTGLISVTIPDSLTRIGNAAFASCTSLASLSLPDRLTFIGQEAFRSCTSLAGSVVIPANITFIGSAPFADCTSLMGINVDLLNPVYRSEDGVLFNKDQTLLYQYPAGKAGRYSVPNGVTSIEILAFSECSSLSSVSLPDSITLIEFAAFAQCTGLASIAIPDSVTQIGKAAFSGCRGLTNIILPSGLTNIEESTFLSCSRLGSIVIPSSVTHLAPLAFADCTRLTGVLFDGNAVGADTNVFSDSNRAILYYLPGATGWSSTLDDRPARRWQVGVWGDQFRFTIDRPGESIVVVEAAMKLDDPGWTPVGTNILTDGSTYFSDPQWTNHPARLYRLRSP